MWRHLVLWIRANIAGDLAFSFFRFKDWGWNQQVSQNAGIHFSQFTRRHNPDCHQPYPSILFLSSCVTRFYQKTFSVLNKSCILLWSIFKVLRHRARTEVHQIFRICFHAHRDKDKLTALEMDDYVQTCWTLTASGAPKALRHNLFLWRRLP